MSKFGLHPKHPQPSRTHAKSTSDSGVSSNSASGNLGGHTRSNSQLPPNPTKTVQFQIAGQPKPASGKQTRSDSSLELSLTDFLGTLSKDDLIPPTGSGTDTRTTDRADHKSPRTGSPQAEKIRTFFEKAKQHEDPRIESQSSPSLDNVDTALTSSATPTTVQLASAPQQHAGPVIRQDTEWDDLAPDSPQARHALTGAADIEERSKLLDSLFLALEGGQTTRVASYLEKIPPEVTRYDHYFPVALLKRNDDNILRLAQQYNARAKTDASQRLLVFVQDGKHRFDAQRKVAEHHRGLTPDHMKHTYLPAVNNLCVLLRDATDRQLKREPEKFVKAIAQAMKHRNLMSALATQPYANLRMLHLKCTVLAEVIDSELSQTLLAKIEEARGLQKRTSSDLRAQLLAGKDMDFDTVAALCLSEYAKQMTSLPIDYVSAGATWDEVNAMVLGMRLAYEHHLEQGQPEFAPVLAAMKWVLGQLRDTQRLADGPTAQTAKKNDTAMPQRRVTASQSNIADALFESLEGLHSIGKRGPADGVTVLSTPVGTGPDIEPVFEWATDPQALLSEAGLTSSARILERSKELLNLLQALEANDMARVLSALVLIPPEVEHHDHYFPAAPFIEGYDDFATTAALYAQKGTAPSWQRLQQFMEACDRRVQAFNQVLTDHAALTEAQLDLRYTPKVKALCVALRLAHELEIADQSQNLSFLIRRAVVTHGEALPGLLAQQPFVGLRMALIKCTVLAAHMDAQLIASFRTRVLQAIDIQRNASGSLRTLLLTDTLDETTIASLALVEYAKQATSVPVDYVSAGATWQDVSAMLKSLDLVFAHYAEQDDTFGPELAALHGVMVRMRHSLGQQPR